MVFVPDNIQLFVEKFTIHNLRAPRKWGIPELNENYAHVKLGPSDRLQGVV